MQDTHDDTEYVINFDKANQIAGSDLTGQEWGNLLGITRRTVHNLATKGNATVSVITKLKDHCKGSTEFLEPKNA